MYSEEKIKWVKRGGLALVVMVLFFIGFGLGHLGKPQTLKEAPPHTSNTPTTLTEGTVKQFLIAFYTKKDLSENRDRYKPLMTGDMYNQEVAIEDEPVNQAYKGYIIDQVFESATIYINVNDLTAICQVNYTNTQLREKGQTSNALTNQSNTDTLQMTFIKQGHSYLVNDLTPMTLSTPNATTTDGNTYGGGLAMGQESNGFTSSNAANASQSSSSSSAPSTASSLPSASSSAPNTNASSKGK